MSTKRYSGSLALTKMKHVIMDHKNKDGRVIRGIFIPVEANHLVPGKENAYYMPISVNTNDEADQYGQNGFIGQQVDSKTYKEADDAQKEEFKKLPILGNIKDFSGNANDNSGSASAAVINPEEDDLPF